MTRWIHNSSSRYQWAVVVVLVILLSILGGGGFVKKSEVFRAAMWELASSESDYWFRLDSVCGCCIAIHSADDSCTSAGKLFYRIFGGGNRTPGLCWRPEFGKGYTARIIALELAALIAEEEGD